MKRLVLFRSPRLEVFINSFRPLRSSVVVICFQYRCEEPHLCHPGFGEEFFERAGIDTVFVNCADNAWYQYDEMPKALSLVQRHAGQWPRSVTYGSSMGGYAALRFARALDARTSIAVGPQYSPRSSVVPGETRYDDDVCGVRFLHEDAHRISAAVENFVLYDPLLALDARHVQAYAREAPLIAIKVPAGGHTPSLVLAQCGLLAGLVLGIIDGTFRPFEFRRHFRRVRASSSVYWAELAVRLLEHGHPAATVRAHDAARQRVSAAPSS